MLPHCDTVSVSIIYYSIINRTLCTNNKKNRVLSISFFHFRWVIGVLNNTLEIETKERLLKNSILKELLCASIHHTRNINSYSIKQKSVLFLRLDYIDWYIFERQRNLLRFSKCYESSFISVKRNWISLLNNKNIFDMFFFARFC